jgi:uncharacterized protein YheU (UPF0270 family)
MDTIEIPYQQLAPETLHNIIKEFVLREGTDYGSHEYSLEEKIITVKRQLETGRATITFDDRSGTPNIVVKGV